MFIDQYFIIALEGGAIRSFSVSDDKLSHGWTLVSLQAHQFLLLLRCPYWVQGLCCRDRGSFIPQVQCEGG